MTNRRIFITLLALTCALPLLASAQGTAADYARANSINKEFAGLTVNIPGPTNWIAGSDHFWYHKTVPGGREFIWVDATTLTKRPAFDHARLAAALSDASGTHYTALTLPFSDANGERLGRTFPRPGGLQFINGEQAIAFGLGGYNWTCSLSDYTCTRGEKMKPQRRRFFPPPPFASGANGGIAVDAGMYPPPMMANDPVDGLEDLVPFRPQTAQPPSARPQAPPPPNEKPSPNGDWIAYIQNFNVWVRRSGDKTGFSLSTDGSEGNDYSLRTLAWSPDSTHLAAYAIRPGYDRHIQYVESSPTTQLQPIAFKGPLYRKPGDTLPIAHPALFDLATRTEIPIPNTLFPNPFNLTPPKWWKDSRGFTFEYNQRGHEVYRVLEVSAATGKARTLIEEDSKTFVDYRPLVPNPTDTGKYFRNDVNDGGEIIWASERDGWEHLYLYNGVTGQVIRKITTGPWPVRAVDYVDPVKRQIWFEASGMTPGEDPYYINYYRINFDGTGLTTFTSANGDHTVSFSPDHKFYTDEWSTVEQPPISELRRTGDQKVLMTLERADDSKLLAAGWKPPLIMHAKGRDGTTDIWGIIWRPTNFDPSKKYPVVESIYAGPQGNFVPETFRPRGMPLAELGFVVAQIDGMGTNNRSRAFHDVAWQNLADAGFPDRIRWHKAAAARYPWYDISHGVGIYGTSAGGQSALAALLFHGDFYTVAVANSGCYDNRMDKIWWNEQYMGWPIGPQYTRNSDMVNAYRLRGKLLLVFGELDGNVDPSSTVQVVNQLIEHHKRFGLLEVPGGGHGAGGEYYQHRLEDFFVHNLLQVEPPLWNTKGTEQ